MAWSPILNLLATVEEFQNVNATIGYLGSITGPIPVTITAVETNPTITVSGDTISGYYSDAFDNKIYYRPTGEDPSKDDYVEDVYPYVVRWSELPSIPLQIYHYDADETTSKQFDYIAQADSFQNTYNIVVTNNYSPGRNALLRALQTDTYEQFVKIKWINNTDSVVPWVNSQGQETTWETNAWL